VEDEEEEEDEETALFLTNFGESLAVFWPCPADFLSPASSGLFQRNSRLRKSEEFGAPKANIGVDCLPTLEAYYLT